MSSTAGPPASQSGSWFWPIVVVCLAVQAVLAADCARRWAPTHDEYWHLPIGLRMWRTGRLDEDVINPPPVRLWAAIPLAIGGAKPGETESRLDVGDIGDTFWNANSEQIRLWFFLGRLMIVPLATLTGLVIACWSRRWYGDWAGCLSALLWSCCPTALANAAIVTHDLPLAAAWTATLFCLVRFAEAPCRRSSLAFGACLGIALLAKLTALLLIPLTVLLWGILRLGFRAASGTATSHSTCDVKAPSLRRIIGLWAFALMIALVIVNCCYLFRGTGTSFGSLVFSSSRLQYIQRVLSWVPVPLPGDYIAAVDRLALDVERKHPVYLDGEWSDQPFIWYYASALSYKLSLSLLALSLTGLAGFAWPRPGSQDRRRGLFLVVAALTLPVLASRSPNQIGIRYVLPTIPLLCIFAGQAALWLADWNAKALPKRFLSAAIWTLIVAAPLSLRFHPHHLAYFNVLAGGPSGGRWHLVDSNIDWGQDLFELRDYLVQNKISEIGLAYFGTVIPSKVGIVAHEPPSRFPQPGWYAISVNFVQGRPHAIRKANGDRFQAGLEEFGYFRFFTPVADIGHSIYVYHLTQQDVARYAFELRKLQRGMQ